MRFLAQFTDQTLIRNLQNICTQVGFRHLNNNQNIKVVITSGYELYDIRATGIAKFPFAMLILFW